MTFLKVFVVDPEFFSLPFDLFPFLSVGVKNKTLFEGVRGRYNGTLRRRICPVLDLGKATLLSPMNFLSGRLNVVFRQHELLNSKLTILL